ncbi:hypothetical protein WA026_016859 [Henosepilachna vigintioctopunctata]|uniref:ABC transporter domain-containing protein n=1 Tax=Henosepilachna vigintioctopunctata TaxID=420089 RepID=A0AAW1U2I6_9CUCU
MELWKHFFSCLQKKTPDEETTKKKQSTLGIYISFICIDGIDIRDFDISWMRKNTGLVSQEAVLFANTIAENIRFGKMLATQAEIVKAAEKAHIHSFINSLPKGYETVLGERGMQLSGGQKQRIALARALIRKPSILLLDEATSALDSVSEAEVQSALESVRGNCTTIIVAHRLSTIKNADQIFVFSEGEVVEQGTYLELMERKNHFFKLRKKQNHYNSLETKNRKTSQIMNFRRDLETIGRDEGQEELDHMTKKNEKNNEKFLLEILRMSKPEWKLIILGVLASIGVGSSLCLHSIIFSNILWSFSMQDEILMKRTVLLNCIFYFCLGVGSGLSYILQCYAFG